MFLVSLMSKALAGSLVYFATNILSSQIHEIWLVKLSPVLGFLQASSNHSVKLGEPAMFQVLGQPWDSEIIKHNHAHFSRSEGSHILFAASVLFHLQRWTPGQQHLCDDSSFPCFVHKCPSLDHPPGRMYWDAVQYPDAWGHREGSPDIWNQTCFNFNYRNLS